MKRRTIFQISSIFLILVCSIFNGNSLPPVAESPFIVRATAAQQLENFGSPLSVRGILHRKRTEESVDPEKGPK